MITTKTDIQIRFADIDILRHVNNVNLQHYFDLGKSDYYAMIMGGVDIAGPQGIVTVNTNTSYLGQTRMDDKIYVETSCEHIGEKSITLYQRIINHITGNVNAESRSVMVCFNFVVQESIPVPAKWRAILEKAME